ncbi:MAG: type-4 uracil-DNA glycosylase [Candidatus Methanomethylicaceae archaeon]
MNLKYFIMNLNELEIINKEIIECKKCRLWSTRNKPVPGNGNINAKIMLIGEAPGYYEDIEGKPFVGLAGRLLNQILKISKLDRNSLFITNIVKCRPPNNRDPLDDEINSCSLYLDKQVSIIKPKLIVCLGKHSSKYVLKKGGIDIIINMANIRGKIFSINYEGLKIITIPTYHPAAALYNPKIKKYLIEDFKMISKLKKKWE